MMPMHGELWEAMAQVCLWRLRDPAEATGKVPSQNHAPMEPMNATASVYQGPVRGLVPDAANGEAVSRRGIGSVRSRR